MTTIRARRLRTRFLSRYRWDLVFAVIVAALFIVLAFKINEAWGYATGYSASPCFGLTGAPRIVCEDAGRR